jgi:hypothetical protein
MKRTIAIHQPDFLPWLGFFDRWKQSDLLILLDDVQFLRRGWHHRDQIKTRNGSVWLTVPVKKKGLYGQLINQVEVDNGTDWQQRHLATIEHAYKKAPFFEPVFAAFRESYIDKADSLVAVNLRLLQTASFLLGIRTPVVLSSRYKVSGQKSERLLELIRKVEGTHYLTGTGSRNYLDEGLFKKENVEVLWQEFRHPVYAQLHGAFVPNLSVLDFLMNAGGQHAL